MSIKKSRAWFVCRQWPKLVSQHYANDVAVGRALGVDIRVLAKLRVRSPVAKSTILHALRSYAAWHDPGLRIVELVVDTRAR